LCIKRDFCDCDSYVVEYAYTAELIGYIMGLLLIYLFIKPQMKTRYKHTKISKNSQERDCTNKL